MKIRKTNQALFILSGLIILSFAFFVIAQEKSNGSENIFLDSDQDGLTDEEEKIYGTDIHNPDSDGDSYSDGAEVKSGYDPMKPAPGDKLLDNSSSEGRVEGTETNIQAENGTSGTGEENLTEQMAQKISEATQGDSLKEGDVNLSDIQEIVNSTLNSTDIEEELPQVSKDEINIVEQDYDNLSEEEALDKEKEDFTNYLIGVYYILASNSPEPITSTSDLSSAMGNLSVRVVSAMISRDTSSLNSLTKSGKEILDQMKEIEVPENLADLHVEALSLAEYAATIKDKIAPISDDPMKEIVNLSKVQNFLGLAMNFSAEVESKFIEYDLFYDDEMREKIQSFGLIAPGRDDLSVSEITGGLVDDGEK